MLKWVFPAMGGETTRDTPSGAMGGDARPLVHPRSMRRYLDGFNQRGTSEWLYLSLHVVLCSYLHGWWCDPLTSM